LQEWKDDDMTQILRGLVGAAVCAVSFSLVGCPGAQVPGMTGGDLLNPQPIAGASALPSAAPSVVDPVTGCTRTPPAAFTVGTKEMGAYNNQRLPKDWESLKDEAAVTKAIGDMEAKVADWPCFQSFWKGAVDIYKAKKGTSTPAPSASPSAK
jgi:hypothetical protein